MKYRKKPVVIEAWYAANLILASETCWRDLPPCVADAYEKGTFIFCPDHISIKTLEGTMRAEREDVVIQGVKGEFYPCKRDIFEATYEKVE